MLISAAGSVSSKEVDGTSFYCLTLKLSFKLPFYQAEVDGSNEFNDFEPASLNTTNQLIKDLKNIDVVFHIGDIAYANGSVTVGSIHCTG